MSDLISRQALKEKLHFMFEWYGRLPCSEEDKCIQRTIKRCMGELNKAPTIDAVEVIRCKDCEHSCESLNADYLLCAVWENLSGMAQVNPMGFCYEAKEKEGDA